MSAETKPEAIEEFRRERGRDEDYTVLHFPCAEWGGDVCSYNPATQQAVMLFKCHPEEQVVLRVSKVVPHGTENSSAFTIIMGRFMDSEGARKYWWACIDRSVEGERNYADSLKAK